MGEEYLATNVVCAECMKMCCLGGKNSMVKGLIRFIVCCGLVGSFRIQGILINLRDP